MAKIAFNGWVLAAAFGACLGLTAGAGFVLGGCGGDDTKAAAGDGGGDGTVDGTLGDSNRGDGSGGDSMGGGDSMSRTDGPVGFPDGGGLGDGSPTCLQLGGHCNGPADCCTNTCTNGVCAFPACVSDNQPCTTNGQCCSGICNATAGTCTPLTTACSTLGNTCTQDSNCCSMFCSGGVCSVSSFCGQTNDVCQVGANCCSGICNVPMGQMFGTCGNPPTGPANCGQVDGTVCQMGQVATADSGILPCGGPCCSRSCEPYGPTGVYVCQPASGCHVVGDLCLQNSDCCGSSGLPGGPTMPVTCDFSGSDGGPLGICRNPIGCKPNGDVCKTAVQSCTSSCNCCSGNCETMDTCKQDNVGVPRCAFAQCQDAGASCASSADCCNGTPCVPVDGGYQCYTGGSCVPTCGACTNNADCCPGETCITQLGGSGVCGPCGGPTPDGGTGDGGTVNDGGTVVDSGPTCALYGQQCTMNSDCCNSVPCSNGTGPCLAGQTGCTCHYPIQ